MTVHRRHKYNLTEAAIRIKHGTLKDPVTGERHKRGINYRTIRKLIDNGFLVSTFIGSLEYVTEGAILDLEANGSTDSAAIVADNAPTHEHRPRSADIDAG